MQCMDMVRFFSINFFLTFTRYTRTGRLQSQPADIFGGGGQNDCNLLLYLTAQHVFEISRGGEIARPPMG